MHFQKILDKYRKIAFSERDKGSNGIDSFRKTIEKEFDVIYVFNLKRNARTQGQLRRRDAGHP